MEIEYTLHGMERCKERANINMKKAARQMKLAIERGYRAANCRSCVERNFLEDRSSEFITAIAYNGHCYIYREDTHAVLTVYKLPNWWGKKKHYAGKERIKRAKCYYRFNDDFCVAM